MCDVEKLDEDNLDEMDWLDDWDPASIRSYVPAPTPLNPAPTPRTTLPPEIFTTSIMDRHPQPLAYYLEPEGWAIVQGMHRPTSKTWKKHCPRTYAIAEVIYNSLSQKQVWGKQDSEGWKTITAGKQVKMRTAHFPQQPMKLIDVLNALGHPHRYALGSHDRKMDELEGDDWFEFDRMPLTRVRHLRLDVDMDDAYRIDTSLWGIERGLDKPKPEWVRQELAMEQSALCSMGLCAHFFRTGRRGHQIVIPTPPLDRSVASLVILMMRCLLSGLHREPGRAKIDKSNLDGLLRLPLGRHNSTFNIAWFLDPDTGENVPLEQQAQALEEAWIYQGRGCDVLEESAEAISDALLDMGYDRDMDITASVTEERQPALLARILNELRETLPDCPLLEAFQVATEKVIPLYSVSDFSISDLLEGVGLLSDADGGADDVDNQDKDNQDVKTTPAQKNTTAQLPTHQDVCEDSDFEDTDFRTDDSATSSYLRATSVKHSKVWAQKVIDEGFKPGEFYKWWKSDGKNGIGAAIILWGKEQATGKLIEYVQKVPADPKHMAIRISTIRWAVPRNNIREDYESPALRQHRDIEGIVQEEECVRAKQIVEMLVQRRRDSSMRRKVFDPKALLTIQHIVELVQVEVRNTSDGPIRLSYRTLEAGIKARWPEHSTSEKDVDRQMKWIVEGAGCLFAILKPLNLPRTVYQAPAYALGQDYLALLAG